MHFPFLSVSAFTVRTRLTVFRKVLFSSLPFGINVSLEICRRGFPPRRIADTGFSKSRSYSSAQSHETSANRAPVPVLPFTRRSLSDPCQSVTLLFIKLMECGRRDAQEQEASCQTPFQFIQFLCNQSAHSFSSFLHRNQKAPVP